MDAERLLTEARRPLCIGIGGGGDVVGALATGEACRLYAGARPVLGGVSWERRPIDPLPGPRAAAEIEDAAELGPGVLTASATTRVRASGVRFAEARMAEFLAEPTVLVDVNRGAPTVARGLAAAVERLECDLVVLVDVGGDALAHGGEPGLASPLCDAVMLAAGAILAEEDRVPVLAGVFGIGCDGELAPAEVLERLAEVAAAGGLAGVARTHRAGGRAPGRGGRRDPHRGERAGAALLPWRARRDHVSARAGAPCSSRRWAPPRSTWTRWWPCARQRGSRPPSASAPTWSPRTGLLNALGVRTELDWEREAAHTSAPASPPD